MKFDIIKIIELLQGYRYELDIIPLEENCVRIKVHSGESYSSKTINLNTEARYAGNPNDIIYRRVLEVIMNLKAFEGGYRHVNCSCGGIIGDESGKADVDMIRCLNCGKVYPIWKLDYDVMYRNEKTNWIYPVKERLNIYD